MPAYKNKGFFIGIAAFLMITLCGIFDLVPSSLTDLDGMKFDEGTKSVDSISAWFVLAVLVLMAIWWATEALPVAVTSLLPLALFPILDISNFQAAADPYAALPHLGLLALGALARGVALVRVAGERGLT